MTGSDHRNALALAAGLAALLFACNPSPPPPAAQRLVDRFSPALLTNSPRGGAPPPALEWSGAAGWKPLAGIRGLRVAGGRLTGETTTATAALRLSAIRGIDPGDLLAEVRVRMRVSAAGSFGIHLVGPHPNGFDQALLGGAPLPWPNQGPVRPGQQLATVVLRPIFPVPGADVDQILLRPVDVPGARFEIASVRLVFRREELASVPSGVSWNGLAGFYREAVVARAPEAIRWEMTLPDRPRLTLALGTVEERPVTFRVELRPAAPDRGAAVTLVERTLTTPHRWDEVARNLDRFAGRRVVLSLSLAAAQPGALGLWGSPVVRCRAPRSGARIASAGSGLSAGLAAATAAPRPQGVILILADTLRADRLEAYGGRRPTAPTLARMAREGALFRDAVAPATWTKVSMPAILTSLSPLTTGVRDFPDRLPSAATTLAEVYRRAGYATMGFSSAPFTGAFSNLQQGYEELFEVPFDRESSKTARFLTDLLLPWLDAHRDEPFFLLVHFFDPHFPYPPDPPYDRLWADPGTRDAHERQRRRAAGGIADPLRKLEGLATAGEFAAAGVDPAAFAERDLADYDGSIRGMDAEVERIFERLRELGLDGRTLVALTADHGEEFFEHGLEFHGQSLYGELTHVPLIVRYPGAVRAGRVVAETVPLLDLLPTLLDLSGLAPPAEAEGQSDAPLLRPAAADGAAPAWKSRPVFVDRPAAPHFASPYPRDRESFAVLDGGWKLIWNRLRPPGVPEFELYDHGADPGDRRDLAALHPQDVARLARLLADWRQSRLAHRLPADREAARELTPEERQRLRSLGYIR